MLSRVAMNFVPTQAGGQLISYDKDWYFVAN